MHDGRGGVLVARGAPAIEDHAAIGDGRSVALVSHDGTIDWLCWPRFDSASLFAALLDPERGGHWSIAPAGPSRTSQRYVTDTNIVETRFDQAGDVAVVTDLMPAAAEADKRHRLLPEHELIREVRCERGELALELAYAPRPGYGTEPVPLRDAGALGVRLDTGRDLVTLRGSVPLELRDRAAVARFVLRAGERAWFSLTWSRDAPAVLPPLGDLTRARIDETARWWRTWARRARYDGPHRELVVRSALALKLLSYAPSGAIVAAATTSLPEAVGAALNWDYRYCWIRDAALTVRALLDLGYDEEADAFVSWLLHSTRLTRPALCVLYDVFGGVPAAERELAHLRGYRESHPVRIGNAAAAQFQLDVYGELIDAVHEIVARRDRAIDGETQAMLADFGRFVCHHWHQPDDGIWEVRGGGAPFTHSRVLCWVALDRLLALHRRGAIRRIPVAAFERDLVSIRREIDERCWSPALQSYTQTLGGDSVDASLLLMSWYGYLAPDDARMRATARRVFARLDAGPGLLYRYEQSLAAGEGAFGICSFWAAEHLARGGGTVAEARRFFDGMVARASECGLFGEEIEPRTGAHLGNFPQAFTHVGLIGAAMTLERRARAASGAAAEAGR